MPSAFAQSGHFVLIAQGNQSSVANTGAYPSSANWIYRYGQGFNGTTTGAFVASQFNKIRSEASSMITLDVIQYSDAGYSSTVYTCSFEVGTGTGNFTDTFFQLFLLSSPSGCVFDPNLYVAVNVSFIGANGGASGNYTDTNYTTYRGSSATTTFLYSNSFSGGSPINIKSVYFSIVANGFQITPTASSSGISISGAQAFCNDAYASSTGIGATIGNGVCVGLGFLFIPTPESMQQFPNLAQTELPLHFPFSWFTSIQSTWQGASATSSSFYNLTLNLKDATASSTNTSLPLILPNITLFSASTIEQYLSTSTRDRMKGFISMALWLGLATDVYFIALSIL